jgi:hypothetical protein
MPDELRRQLTLLMRLWQARHGGRLVWRMSIEDAHTGTRRGFTDLESLVAYLNAQLAGGESTPADDSVTKGEDE